MIKRSSKKYINKLFSENPNWKILDIGCGYSADEYATTICDVEDFSSFYKNKNFVKLNDKVLPFKNEEFDFVIASHVLEHVKDATFFIKELERVSQRGYIEVPTILEDNLVFENKNDHIWHIEFNDIDKKIILSKRFQYIEPILTVSSIKLLSNYFRQSLIIELEWEKTIDYEIIEKNHLVNNKLSRFYLFRKFLSKLFRNIFR